MVDVDVVDVVDVVVDFGGLFFPDWVGALVPHAASPTTDSATAKIFVGFSLTGLIASNLSNSSKLDRRQEYFASGGPCWDRCLFSASMSTKDPNRS